MKNSPVCFQVQPPPPFPFLLKGRVTHTLRETSDFSLMFCDWTAKWILRLSLKSIPSICGYSVLTHIGSFQFAMQTSPWHTLCQETSKLLGFYLTKQVNEAWAVYLIYLYRPEVHKGHKQAANCKVILVSHQTCSDLHPSFPFLAIYVLWDLCVCYNQIHTVCLHLIQLLKGKRSIKKETFQWKQWH